MNTPTRLRLILVAMVALLLAIAAYVAVPQVYAPPLVQLNRSFAGLSEQVVQVGRHEIHYLEGGRGETVLLLHGIFAEKDHWVDFARHLTPHYRVITPDLPGYGESSRLEDESYEYYAQAERLHAFLQTLGIERVHLVGSSTGGAIATLYAVRHPEQVRSLAFIGAPHGIRSPQLSEVARSTEAGEMPLIARTPAEFERMLDAIFFQRPFLPRPIYVAARSAAISQAASNERLWRESWSHGYLLPAVLPRVGVPTLAIWGEKDAVFHPSGAEVLRQALPGATVIVQPGVGHLPMMERPREMAVLYREFLQGR